MRSRRTCYESHQEPNRKRHMFGPLRTTAGPGCIVPDRVVLRAFIAIYASSGRGIGMYRRVPCSVPVTAKGAIPGLFPHLPSTINLR